MGILLRGFGRRPGWYRIAAHPHHAGSRPRCHGTRKKFDVILGNPPWTYKGKAGTAARQARAVPGARPPRGEGLDFVRRGMDFAHTHTRLGILLSARPFFARSVTGLRAVQNAVASLGSVMLVNLSDLSHSLFARTNMPAMAVLARLPAGKPGWLELVQARRSPETDRSRTILVASSDVATLSISSWRRNQGLLKAAFLGCQHDLLLLKSLWKRYSTLEEVLRAFGTGWASGLTIGDRSRDANSLQGLPFASTGAISRFRVSRKLPHWTGPAQWPRARKTYRSPLLLVNQNMLQERKEMRAGRPIVAVVDRDTVYKEAYLGVSFARTNPDTAYLLVGILSSSLVSWYFLMTASNFGVWKRSVRVSDVKSLPVPDLEWAMSTSAGGRVVDLVRKFHVQPPDAGDWNVLDRAVFDLYEFDEEDRIIANDGRLRATWQWKAGRSAAAKHVESRQLREYASAFLLSMDAWLHAANERRFRAEIFDTGSASPVQVVRFALEDHPPPSQIVVRNDLSLPRVLADIDSRLGTTIAKELIGTRELRIHAPREVVIVKPAARRFWLGVAGLDDARAVLTKSFAGGTG